MMIFRQSLCVCVRRLLQVYILFIFIAVEKEETLFLPDSSCSSSLSLSLSHLLSLNSALMAPHLMAFFFLFCVWYYFLERKGGVKIIAIIMVIIAIEEMVFRAIGFIFLLKVDSIR